MESKKEAEKAVLSAYQDVRDQREANDKFARVCHSAHRFLSDGEMARLIDFGYSRSWIQQKRQEQERRERRRKKNAS